MLRGHYFGLIRRILLLILTFNLILLLPLRHVVWLAERRFNIRGCLWGLLVKLAELVSIDGSCWFACWGHIIHFVRHGGYLGESRYIQFVGLLMVMLVLRWRRRLILMPCTGMVLIKSLRYAVV